MATMPDASPALAAGSSLAASLRGVSKSFGSVAALKGVDFDLRRGEVHAIVGENGAGKSTLISVMTGVLEPDAGEVRIAGIATAPGGPLAVRDLGLSVVYQHPALAADLSVLDNLRLGVRSGRGALSADAARALLARVASEAHRVDVRARIDELTLAQKHLVEIARALAGEPEVIVFDEPTEPFQHADVDRLFGVIRALRADGTAVVYISHRLHEVMEIADRVSVLRDGEMVATHEAADLDVARVVTLIAGRPLGQIFPPKGTGAGAVRIEVEGLAGSGFSGVTAVLRTGEVTGIAGVEGQGQRAFLRALAGLNPITSGDVRVDDKPVRLPSPSASQAAGLSFLTDDRHAEGLFLSLPIEANVALRVLDRVSRHGVMQAGAERRAAIEATSRLHVRAPSVATPVADLSGGNQQKVLFAREVNAGGAVYLIDEPTKGVDVGSRAEIYQQVRALADAGAAVLVLSSDGVELEGLCDRVLVFARGQVVGELSGADVTDDGITAACLTAKVVRAEAGGPGARPRPGAFLHGDYLPIPMLCVALALVVGVTAAGNPYFLSTSNVSNMLAFVAVLGLVGCAQLLAVIVGGIDLSVGPLAGLAVVLASFLMGSDASGPAIAAAGLGIVAAGAAFGLAQGALVSCCGLPAIVVTLVSFIGLQGVSLVLRPQPTGGIADALGDFAGTPVLGIPAALCGAVATALALEAMLSRTGAGRRLRAVGSDPVSAHKLGVSRVGSILLAFLLSGGLAAFAGLLLAGQIGIGSATVGIDYTLLSVTVVVLSGASIAGGRGSFVCVLFAAVLVQSTASASSFVQIDPAWQYVVVGVIAIAAASLFGFARRRGAAATA